MQRIVIVGGGSAGWLTAAVIAAEHGSSPGSGIQVTLIESPDVNPIGVGEGTWPTMRDTLRKIGVSETDFIRECDASFKQGSQFVGWVTGRDGDSYFHPFMLPHGHLEANLVSRWLAKYEGTPSAEPFAEQVSVQPHLCRHGRAPKQITTPEFAAVANYAYHLDAGKFGQFLQRHCVDKLGVIHLRDRVCGIESAANGDIASLRTERGGSLSGDLFIDCSGFAAMLLGRHYEIPFLSRKDVLFNDRALALQVPYAGDGDPVVPHTVSTAGKAGWIWDIGLPSRRGIGYVYSSAHSADDEAEEALMKYVGGTSEAADASRQWQPRKISFEPGHREVFWHRNCVAVGLAAGFIEPLEASALALIELSAAMISDEMPATREVMDAVAGRFNSRFRYRWERIVEFLKLHYLLSQRTDAAYWEDNRRKETVPERLLEQLSLWRFRAPSRYDFYQVEEIFPSASYQYVLYGMGFKPDRMAHGRRSDEPERADAIFTERANLTAKMLAGLPPMRELLDGIRQHGLQRI